MELARGLARDLVKQRLVACANLLPGVVSIYEWQGTVEEDSEVMMVLKTTLGALPRLEKAFLSAHPYDTPEFVVLDPAQVEPRYLAWLRGSVD